MRVELFSATVFAWTLALSFGNFAKAEISQVLNFDRLFGFRTNLDIKSFALGLHQIGAFKISQDGSQAVPFYLDLHDAFSSPEIRSAIVSGLTAHSKALKFDHVCGLSPTGAALASFFAERTKTSVLNIYRVGEGVDPAGSIKGKFQKGQSCLVVDDVIASGKSLEEVVSLIRRSGLTVKEVVVVIDKGEGGMDRFQSEDFDVHSLVKLPDLLEVLNQNGKITKKDMEIVLSYVRGKRKQVQSTLE